MFLINLIPYYQIKDGHFLYADIYQNNFSDKLDQTLKGDNEDIREGADEAFDELREDLNSQIGSNADKKPTGEWMEEALDKGANAIVGNGKYEKPEEPQPSESPDSEEPETENNNNGNGNTQEPPQDDAGNGTHSGSGNVNLDEHVLVPVIGLVPLKDVNINLLIQEYEKMFDKPTDLSEEQMKAI